MKNKKLGIFFLCLFLLCSLIILPHVLRTLVLIFFPAYTPYIYLLEKQPVEKYVRKGELMIQIEGKTSFTAAIYQNKGTCILGPIRDSEHEKYLILTNEWIGIIPNEASVYFSSDKVLLTDLSFGFFDLASDMKGWDTKYKILNQREFMKYIIYPSTRVKNKIEFRIPSSYFSNKTQ